MKMFRAVVLLLSIVFLVQCTPASQQPKEPNQAYAPGVSGKNIVNGGTWGVHLWRIVDAEAGVVCYIKVGNYTSPECLPISQTKLEGR